MKKNCNGVAYVAMMGEIDVKAAESLIQTISALPEHTHTVYLLFSTIGGSVCHGFAIYYFLRALPYKIITHNIGNVDSIGNIIFLAGEERYSTKHSLFLCHRVKVEHRMRMLDLSIAQERLNGIEKDEERIREIFRTHTRISDEDLNSFFDIGEYKTAEMALQSGMIHDIRNLPCLKKVSVIEICK